MGLFKPAWQSNNLEEALKAVKELTNQRELARVVRDAGSIQVEKAALGKLTDRKILEKFATSGVRDIREAASERLDSLVWQERIEKADKITDQRILADVAKNTGDYGAHNYWICGMTALQKITDQEILADVAKNGKNESVRTAALDKITDQAKLVDIAINSWGQEFASEILSKLKLSDQVALDIIANCKSRDMRLQTLWAIKKSSAIADILIGATDNKVIDDIFWFLSNKTVRNNELLTYVFEKAKADYVKNLALKELGGYICSSCKCVNIPEEGHAVSCTCKRCKTENHCFIKEQETITLDNTTEKVITWEKCQHCGLERNRNEEIRFTDW